MKTKLIFVMTLVLTMLYFTACGIQPQTQQPPSQNTGIHSITELVDSWVWDDFTWGVGIFHINADSTGSFTIEGIVQYTFTWESPEDGIFAINTTHWGLETFRYSIADGIFTIVDVHTDEVFRYMRESYFNDGHEF